MLELVISLALTCAATLSAASPAAAPRLVVDRIEGRTAVIEVAGTHFVDVPVELLPDGADEGAVLRFELVQR